MISTDMYSEVLDGPAYTFLNVFPHDSGTVAVFSYFRGERAQSHTAFGETWDASGDHQKYLLSKLVLRRCSNFVIAPNVFETFSESQIEVMQDYFDANIHPRSAELEDPRLVPVRASMKYRRRAGRTSSSSLGTRAPTTANGTPSVRSPRSRSVTTGRSAGSSRGIAQYLREQQLGGLQRLSGSAVTQFGVREQIRRSEDHVVVPLWDCHRPGRLDHQEVATASGRLRKERSLNLAIVQDSDRRVDLGVLGAEEVIPLAGRIRASQRPSLPTFRKHLP
jgi:hypothetical protein